MTHPDDFEQLASGFGLVEGPTLEPDGALVFSDVLGGGVFRLGTDLQVETVVPKRRGVGGIALHADGGVVLSGRHIVHVLDGETRTLLQVEGSAGWNDLCTDREGRVYAGLLRFAVFDPKADPIPGECWRIDAPGSGERLYGDVIHANGIALSLDGRTLYHSDTRGRRVVVHELDDAGAASKRRSFDCDGAHPDGMALDVEGGLWVAMAGAGRIDRFDPDGRVERSIGVPARLVTSLCFAGDGLDELIAVTGDNDRNPEDRGSIFRAPAPVPGAPVHPARV